MGSFSPVAGIQWVETKAYRDWLIQMKSFSPVAGIQWVETLGLTGGDIGC